MVVKKAKLAHWVCRGGFGKTWGLKAKVVYWLYTVVIRPIITCASLIWLPRTILVSSRNQLGSLQRVFCLAITEAMRTIPIAALDSNTGTLPVHDTVKSLLTGDEIIFTNSDIMLKYTRS